MAPLFEHYGVQLWMPEAGGQVNFAAEGDEQLMLALGVQSKREITRTRIRVRTAMAAQARERGRYLVGRPRMGTGWRMRAHTQTGRTPRGADAHGIWNPARAKNVYIREDHILPHLPALYARLTGASPAARRRRRRTRAGIEVARPISAQDVIGYLRAREITLTCDPQAATLQADTPHAVTAVIGRAS
jgi:hypothetical protein